MNFFTKIKTALNRDGKYSLYNSIEKGSYNNKTAKDYLTYNDISLYVNRAIDKRADKVSEVSFYLKNKKGEIITESPILDLLNKPNEFHTGKQFWKLFQKYLDITGTAYIYLKRSGEVFKGEVEKMYLLRPDLVKVNRDENTGEVIAFEYRNGNKTTTYTKDEVLIAIEPDPLNPITGASLLKSGIRNIETALQLDEYQADVLKNGGRVEGVFNFKSALNSEQLKKLKESYEDQFAGAKKSGIPLFLGGDADYKKISLNPEELSFLQSKGSTLNDICILTGVPKTVLGALGDETFSNADTALRVFLSETIKPLLINLRDFLDWRLIADDLTLEFVDPTPENIDNKIKIINATYATDTSTINERRKIAGLEEIKNPDADKIWVSFSKTPIDATADLSTASVKKSNKKEHPLKDKSFREAYKKIVVKRMDKREAIIFQAIKDYFADQETRLLSHLTGIKSFKKKSAVDEIFNTGLEINLAKNTVLPLLRKIMREAGQDTTDMLDYEFGFTLTSDVEKWLDNRANLFAEEITSTTYDKLSRTFAESFNLGENREQLVNRIQDVYTGFDETRARTIARTEVHGATQKANYDAHIQASMPIKIWVAVLDDATRESHAYLDGEEQPIDHNFSNGLRFPGDPNGDAGEVINCRCSM